MNLNFNEGFSQIGYIGLVLILFVQSSVQVEMLQEWSNTLQFGVVCHSTD